MRFRYKKSSSQANKKSLWGDISSLKIINHLPWSIPYSFIHQDWTWTGLPMRLIKPSFLTELLSNGLYTPMKSTRHSVILISIAIRWKDTIDKADIEWIYQSLGFLQIYFQVSLLSQLTKGFSTGSITTPASFTECKTSYVCRIYV